MFPHLPSALHLDRLTRQQVSAGAIAAVVVASVAWYALTRKKVTPEEIERERRTLLALSGRITDGSIVGIDGRTEETSADGSLEMLVGARQPPQVLIYRYRIAGVTYECAQDVSPLAEQVRNLRIDLPVQVRYEPNNPGNSILVAEQWSGVQQDTPTRI